MAKITEEEKNLRSLLDKYKGLKRANSKKKVEEEIKRALEWHGGKGLLKKTKAEAEKILAGAVEEKPAKKKAEGDPKSNGKLRGPEDERGPSKAWIRQKLQEAYKDQGGKLVEIPAHEETVDGKTIEHSAYSYYMKPKDFKVPKELKDFV